MKVALVGFANSQTDTGMLDALRGWLKVNRQPPLSRYRRVIYELNGDKPKDFLADNEQYDMVVLMYLFAGGLDASMWAAGSGETRISPLSSPEKWRERLLVSRAQTIVTFGGSTEVSAMYLGQLPGYDRKVMYAPGTWAVYRKQ